MPNTIDDRPPIGATVNADSNVAETSTEDGGVHHHSGAGVTTVDGHPTPGSGGVIPGDGTPHPGGILGLVEGFNPGHPIAMYGFDQSKAPRSVGFVDVLKALGRSPNAAQSVEGLLAHIRATFGVTVPPDKAQAILHRPELVLQFLHMTPAQLRGALDQLHESGGADQLGLAARKLNIEASTFNWSQLGALDVAMPKDAAKELAPGLYRGHVRNTDITDTQAKNNIVMAEVLERLADNSNLPASERFTFRYQGGDGHTHEITRLPELIKALRADGYVVKAHSAQMVANFAHLMTKAGDQWLDIAAPIMVETPFNDQDGKPVVVPTVHSELAISIERGPSVPGSADDLTCQVKWYQGVPNTGFMPGNLYRKTDWTGMDIKDRFEGDEAARVIEYAGLYSDMINDVARDQGLAVGGYGATGVCIDTVAVLQALMKRPLTAYPMLHSDEIMIGEALRRHDGAGSRLDRPEYRDIIETLRAVDDDSGHVDLASMSPTKVAALKARILASLPWPPGQESLTIARDTRRILG